MSESSQSLPIRIVIVDDQTTIREALKALLEIHSDFNIVGTAASGEEAIALIRSLQPDIALVDIEMPGISGIEVTKTLKELVPQTRVLVLSSHDSSEYLSQAFQAGAKGYLLKNTPAEDLATTLKFVYKGYSQISPGLMEKVFNPGTGIAPSSNSDRSENVTQSWLDLELELEQFYLDYEDQAKGADQVSAMDVAVSSADHGVAHLVNSSVDRLDESKDHSFDLLSHIWQQIQDLRFFIHDADRLVQSAQKLLEHSQDLEHLMQRFRGS